MPHRNDVQGLRAIAVLLVALCHSGAPVAGGFIGVDVFFVISGFVIGRMLLGELRRTGTLDLPAFYARRARRLLPGLATMLVFVGIVAFVVENPLGSEQNVALTGLTSLFFVANIYLMRSSYFSPPAQQNPLLHVWTLSVEEQFYLLFPLLLLAAAYLGRRGVLRRTADGRQLGLLLVVCAISAALGVVLMSGNGQLQALAFYGSPARVWEFGVGALLALGESRLRVPAVPAAFAGCIAIGIAALTYSAATPFPGFAAALPVAGTALVIAAGSNASTRVTRALALPPLLWLGDRSYGFYLWHWPFIVFATALGGPSAPTWLPFVAAGTALIPTALSYRYIERPVRYGRRFSGRRVLRVVGLGVVPAAVVLLPLFAGATIPADSLRDFARQSAPHLTIARNCDGNLPNDTVTQHACTWSSGGAAGTIVLIGDSNAAQFSEPMIAAAQGRGFDLVVATFSGCPFADVAIRYALIDETACRTFFESWMRYLAESRPALVIIANSSPLYLFDAPSPVSLEGSSDPRVATSPDAKALVWQEGIRSSVSGLTAAGVPVVLVQTIPQFRSFDLRACPLIHIELDPLACNETRSRTDVDEYRRIGREAELSALKGVVAAGAVDFTDDLCDPVTCSAFRGGEWQYLDRRHLSVAGAMRLEPRFDALVFRLASTR